MLLKEMLLAADARPAVLDDCVELIDEQVAKKSGLSGMAVKAIYAVVKAIKPGFIREAVDHLIDDFVAELEPFYAAWGGKGPLPGYFAGRAGEIADAMLHVTDGKARGAKNPTLRKSYDKLRPSAQKHVEAAIPGMARIITKHAAQHAA